MVRLSSAIIVGNTIGLHVYGGNIEENGVYSGDPSIERARKRERERERKVEERE